MVISPDEGAIDRNMYFSSVLGCNLGMFYKRRDYTRVVNGRNPIVAHEYLGENVEGKTVFITDDIIASGESMLEVAYELKKRGAKHIIANATFPLFTSGLTKFDKAVAEGVLTAVLGTNMTYHMPELNFDKDHFMVISPDEGAIDRNMYFSSVLGCNLGMFYKRRDYTRVVNGRNPIVAHEYLGESVEGKTVFITDDIIASGESMLEVASELKQRGAKHIIANTTFPLFTGGLSKFDKAVEDGILTAVLGTNLTYHIPELDERSWFFEVDCSKYTAYIIAAINHEMSVSSIIDPIKKIEALLERHSK